MNIQKKQQFNTHILEALTSFKTCTTKIPANQPTELNVDNKISNRTIKKNISQQSINFTSNQFIIKLTSGNLPDARIIVTDDLILENNPIANSLPNNLQIEGELTIHTCKQLIKLPENLVVKSLSIIACNQLEGLPLTIKIYDKLLLHNCNNFTFIPDLLNINKLILKYCNNFTTFFQSIFIETTCILNNCNKVINLPKVSKYCYLKIQSCHEFIALPAGLIVQSLIIKNNKKLNNIPENTVVTDRLCIVEYNKLTTLPRKLRLNSLALSSCNNFEVFPDDIIIKNSLYISDCVKIQFLPAPLQLQKYLSLTRCDNIKQLQDINIKGDLDIYECWQLANIADDVKIYGKIAISLCPNLTAFSTNWVANLPTNLTSFKSKVLLHCNGISSENIQLYNEISAENIHFRAPRVYIEYRLIETASIIAYWRQFANINTNIPPINITTQQKKDLFNFFEKLIQTKSFKYTNTRQELANRIINCFVLLADTNQQVKDEALYIIFTAISSCEDRAILTLTDLDFLKLLREAEKLSITDSNGTALRELAKAKCCLFEINEYAIAHSAKVKSIEEIEFCLAYLIQLAPIFNLPTTTQLMNYDYIANLTDQDIHNAHITISNRITNEYIENFLTSWKPWQQHQRRWSIKKYENLAVIYNKSDNLCDTCPITLTNITTIKDPVYIKNQIYSYDALCTWIIEQGTNPLTNEILDINSIYKRV